MSGDSTIGAVGTINVTTPRRSTTFGISQVIDGIECKWKEITIVHGGSAGSLTSIPLDLSVGVTEALVLILECSLPIVIQLTSSDTTSPGPIFFGLKGLSFLTFTPGEGIVTLRAYNADPSNDAVLEIGIGALGNVTDQPTFWFPQ
jgi:hypothetical protein